MFEIIRMTDVIE